MVSVVLLCICTVSMSKTIVAEKRNYEQRVLKCDMPVVFILCLRCDILALHNLLIGAETEKQFYGYLADLQATMLR